LVLVRLVLGLGFADGLPFDAEMSEEDAYSGTDEQLVLVVFGDGQLVEHLDELRVLQVVFHGMFKSPWISKPENLLIGKLGELEALSDLCNL